MYYRFSLLKIEFLMSHEKKYELLIKHGSVYFTPAKKKLLDSAFKSVKNYYKNRNYQAINTDLLSTKLEIADIAVTTIGLGTSAVLAIMLKEAYQLKFLNDDKITNIFGKQVLVIIKDMLEIEKLNTHSVFSKDFNNEILPQYQKTKRSKKYAQTASIYYGQQSENFRKLFLSLLSDMRVILIKLAEQLYIMRNIKVLSPQEQLMYSRESYYMYAPIAHQLGLYSAKTEFEELGMKYLEKDIYQFIAKKLNDTKRVRDEYIRNFILPIKKALEENNIKAEIKGRPKSIHSIWNKMKTQDVVFEGIYDLFAIRIIIDDQFENIKAEKEACWKIYSLITDFWQPNPKRLRDWISAPKTSGYESLHTTVLGPEQKWVEVQIRTRRMDDIAEKGQAAHWKYKEIKGDKGHNDWLHLIREVLENPEKIEEETSIAKSELYSDNIFVFTPKGEIRKLKKGASVLDFAYSVHTHVGEQCTGAKINNVLVGLKTELKNGDRVEILTSKAQKPKKEWLEFVTSSSAKSRIKRYLNHEIHKKAEEGKKIFVALIDKLMAENPGLQLPPTDKILGKLKWHFRINSNAQFFTALHANDIVVSDELLHKLFVEPERIENQDMLAKLKELADVKDNEQDGDFLYIDEKLSGIDFELSKCCNPIPGDSIFGFVTVSKGTKIHKYTCPNARDMISRYPYRIVKARWKSSGTNQFVAKIKVIGENTMGVVSDISGLITRDKKINMTAINVNSNDDKMFEGEISVKVYDTNHLSLLMEAIKSIKGVLRVYRME